MPFVVIRVPLKILISLTMNLQSTHYQNPGEGSLGGGSGPCVMDGRKLFRIILDHKYQADWVNLSKREGKDGVF